MPRMPRVGPRSPAGKAITRASNGKKIVQLSDLKDDIENDRQYEHLADAFPSVPELRFQVLRLCEKGSTSTVRCLPWHPSIHRSWQKSLPPAVCRMNRKTHRTANAVRKKFSIDAHPNVVHVSNLC